MKKYELTNEFVIDLFGRKLFRIKALVSFGGVNEGELGGYIEKEDNLNHDGNAWVSGNAMVTGYATVTGNAWVSGYATVYGDAEVYMSNHIFVAGPTGSRNDTITFFRTKQKEICVKIGRFKGNIAEFRANVTATHSDNKFAKIYEHLADVAEMWIDLEG